MRIIAESWITDESVQFKVHRARGLRRLVGLIGQRPPAAGSALLFTRCHSVHGVGIRQPLDVVFVDGDWRVTSVRELRRFRFINDRQARHAFELAPGEAQRLGIRRGAVLEKNFWQGG